MARNCAPKATRNQVRVHDFVIPELGRDDHDTSAFAVETIRRWWYRMGQQSYRKQPSFSSPPTPVAAMDREYLYAGLKVRAQIDSNLYPSGLKVSDKHAPAACTTVSP